MNKEERDEIREYHNSVVSNSFIRGTLQASESKKLLKLLDALDQMERKYVEIYKRFEEYKQIGLNPNVLKGIVENLYKQDICRNPPTIVADGYIIAECEIWKLRCKALERALVGNCQYCSNSTECVKYPCYCIAKNAWKLDESLFEVKTDDGQ